MRTVGRWLLGAALVTGAVCAEDSAPSLTLDDCLLRGLEQATAMVNARMDVERSEWRIREVRSLILPGLSARSSHTQYEETISRTGGPDAAPGRDTLTGASAELSQLLYSGGSVRAALAASGTFRELALTQAALQEADLRRDIKTRFYAVILADEAVRIRRDSVAQLESLARQAETKFRGETASEFDVLTAKVQLANERPLLSEALRNRELVREGFRNLIRIDSLDFELQSDEAPLPPLPDLNRMLREGRLHQPAILQAALRVDLLTADLRVERGGYYPELRARAGYGGTNPPYVGSADDEWTWGWNAGLNLEWTLWDGDRRRSIIQNKVLERAQAMETLGETERETALSIRQAWLRLENAIGIYRAGTEAVTLAEKGLAIARTRFDAGIATPLDFNDSNLALNTAQFNRLQSLLAIRVALADLERATGLRESDFHREEP
jgi:outer membrane protein TolC